MLLKSKVLSNVPHGFFNKDGGVSSHEFGSLNCGYYSGDDKSLVTQNLEIVRKKMKADVLFTLKQVHGNGVIVVDESNLSQNAQIIEGDALITKFDNVCVGVVTADCAPVLISGKGVVAAIHCGWRSAKADIIARVVDMLGTSDLVAAIGPCAHVESYRVQDDFIEEFGGLNEFFIDYPDGVHFDLVRYVEDKLRQSDVKTIDIIDIDTVADTEHFFSFRRAQQYTNGKCGRQISCIMSGYYSGI